MSQLTVLVAHFLAGDLKESALRKLAGTGGIVVDHISLYYLPVISAPVYLLQTPVKVCVIWSLILWCYCIYQKDHSALCKFKTHCVGYDWPNKHLGISVIVWKMLGICWQFLLQNYLSCIRVTVWFIPPDSDAVIQSNSYCSTLVSIILSNTHMQIQAHFDVCVTSTMDTFSHVDF